MAPQPAIALDVDFVMPIDHDLGDIRRRQQWFQRPQPDRFVQYLAAQGLPVDGQRQPGILGHDQRQQARGFGAQRGVAHTRHIAPAKVQRAQQRGVQPAAPLQGGRRRDKQAYRCCLPHGG